VSKKNRREFSVLAHLDVMTSVTVNADSLEDALAQARSLKLEDFADLAGDFIDGKGVAIKGVDEL
jgi:glutamate 5-kinase